MVSVHRRLAIHIPHRCKDRLHLLIRGKVMPVNILRLAKGPYQGKRRIQDCGSVYRPIRIITGIAYCYGPHGTACSTAYTDYEQRNCNCKGDTLQQVEISGGKAVFAQMFHAAGKVDEQQQEENAGKEYVPVERHAFSKNSEKLHVARKFRKKGGTCPAQGKPEIDRICQVYCRCKKIDRDIEPLQTFLYRLTPYQRKRQKGEEQIQYIGIHYCRCVEHQSSGEDSEKLPSGHRLEQRMVEDNEQKPADHVCQICKDNSPNDKQIIISESQLHFTDI